MITSCLRYTVSGTAKALSDPPGEYAGNGETTLPGFERIRTEVETPFLAIAVCEVLHGCRQLVP